MTEEQAVEFLEFYKDTIPKEPPIEAIIDKDKHWYHDNEELLEVIDFAIKAIEENEELKAQINRCFREVTNNLKAKNNHDEKLLDCIEQLQKENEKLKANRAGLIEDIERWNEVSYEQHEAIKKTRDKMQSLDEELCSKFLIDDCDKEAHKSYEQCLDILDEYIHNTYINTYIEE